MTEAEKRAQIIAAQAQRESENPRAATTTKARSKGAAKPPGRSPGRFPTRPSPDTDEKE